MPRNPFQPTADQRRGRRRTLGGLVLLLLAAGLLGATAWPAVAGAADRFGFGLETATVRGRGPELAWWCSALRVQVGVVAAVVFVPALLTNRRLSAALAGVAVVGSFWVVGATPARGGWAGVVEDLTEEAPTGVSWDVLQVHLAGAERLDALAAAVARERPDAVTATGARPGVAQSVTPLLEGYRLAGSRPAAGDAGLAVWVRRDVISGAARGDGEGALAASLERGDDRLRLVVATDDPPGRPEDFEGPRVAVGGFGDAPWAVSADARLELVAPGHWRPWAVPLDHAWAELPAGWAAWTEAGLALDDDAWPLHRAVWVRLRRSASRGESR